jgi:dihydropteroate synthase
MPAACLPLCAYAGAVSNVAHRPLVMGILNVTPDSFFDGGRCFEADEAVARGEQMAAEGADVVDVGGESSRPGAGPVEEAEELRRVLPVVKGLARSVRVSIDTTKRAVARAAVEAGATLVNDVSGELWPVAAELGVGWVSMHRRGTPRTMQSLTDYDDVVGEVHAHVLESAARAQEAGVSEVWVDPGIGFAKTAAQNVLLLAALPELAARARTQGAGVLVGTSRKSFLGRYGAPAGRPLGVADRIEASLATAVWAMVAGAGMVRVHDVRETVHAARLVAPDTRAAPAAPDARAAFGASAAPAASGAAVP